MDTLELQRTFLSQYANSHNLLQLLYDMNVCIDPAIDIEKYWLEVHNLDTCDTFGLDVWGIIVAAPRTIEVKSDDWFGFKDTGYMPFNVAPFYRGKQATSVYRLSNDAYRRLIYFKGMVNIMETTLPAIDAILWKFFDALDRPGDAYAQETGVMKMRLVFRFSLTPVERAIFRTYGQLLRPGGVGIEFREIPYDTFGFKDSDLRPFNQGTFYTGPIQGYY